MPPNLAEMTEKQTREMNDLTWAAEDMTDSQSEQPEQTEPEEPEQDDNDNSADDE